MGEVGVLILHGMGVQKSDYAEGFIGALRKQLEKSEEPSIKVVFNAVHYAPVYDQIQQRRAPELKRASLWWQPIGRLARWLILYVISDALSYKGSYTDVHVKVSEALEELQNELEDGAPIIVVAHSLGCMVVSDYIYDRQQKIHQGSNFIEFENLRALITFGCNIPLFEMGHEITVPIENPTAGKEPPKFVWTNFYSPFDVLGYPLGKYYDQAPNFEIRDILFYAGGVLRFWNWFSHNAYWKAGRVHNEIITAILRLAN